MDENMNSNLYHGKPEESVWKPEGSAPQEPAAEPAAQAVPEAEAEEAAGSGKKNKIKRRKKGWLIAFLVIAALLFGVGVGVFASHYSFSFGVPEKVRPEYQLEEVPIRDKVQTAVGDKTMTPAEVYANNVGAVAGIATEATSTNVFGQQTSRASAGSGFVLTDDGYLVTNYHVISGAHTITVTLYSGEQYPARLVGGYADNDVALLKIEAENLQHVTVGKSSDLTVGEQVVAIGNPLGELTYTMTVGYISGLDREINATGKPINMLQTDVAINSGNSGGPVFDMNGNVIAIASAKLSGQTTSGTYIEGLSFAIPVDDVLDILFDLGTYGYVTGRPYLGINLEDLDADTAKTYGLPVGPIITNVEPDGAAEKAGVLKGDIILKLGEETVSTYDELVSALRKYKAGDETTLTVFRGGQEMELKVTLGEKAYTQEDIPVQSSTPAQPEQQMPEQEQPDSFSYFGFPFDFFFRNF